MMPALLSKCADYPVRSKYSNLRFHRDLHPPPRPCFLLILGLSVTDNQGQSIGKRGGNTTWIGKRCWPISRALSMRNSCSETNTWWLKIASYVTRSKDVSS